MASEHAILGSFLGVVTITQVTMGEYIHSCNTEERKSHPLVVAAHVIAGKMLCFVAVGQVWMGFELLKVNSM